MRSGPEDVAWESVSSSTYTFRLKVPGGWLYRFMGEGLCFVPDPDRWLKPEEPSEKPSEGGSVKIMGI